MHSVRATRKTRTRYRTIIGCGIGDQNALQRGVAQRLGSARTSRAAPGVLAISADFQKAARSSIIATMAAGDPLE